MTKIPEFHRRALLETIDMGPRPELNARFYIGLSVGLYKWSILERLVEEADGISKTVR